MSSRDTRPSRSQRLRAKLDHPVLDVDGHVMEFMPAVLPYLREAMGPTLFDRYVNRPSPIANILGADTATRIAARTPQSAWWGTPAENTTDLATAAIPGLMYERLDELGIDYSVLFTTKGFGVAGIADDELRAGVCRGFNDFYADTYQQYEDRMTVAGIVPMHTPDEAIAELQHCKEIGLRAIGFPEGVTRPIPNPQPDNASPFLYPGQTHWFDSFGLDSAHDYDPVWATSRELGFAAMFHGGLGHMPSGSFTSVSNYTFNHIGSFAQRMHTLCKSLFMGGVTTRYPELNFAFLECGVGWATILLCDLLEHWEKRNNQAIETLNPDKIDWQMLAGYFTSHGQELLDGAGDIDLDAALRALPGAGTPPEERDEFRFLDGASMRTIAERFASNFYFGCEADDRTMAFAFAPGNPYGERLRPVFSSDLSHWDVPQMNSVVAYAHSLVREGVLSERDFREFVFENPARLVLRQNPDFFAGTAAERATAALADDARAARSESVPS
jgi:predicted TIM-barrel fold metal-dependent hydrolase